MSRNAVNLSLSDRIRSLALAPDLKAVLVELAEQKEHEDEFAGMVASAAVPAPGSPRHRREHPHLRLVTVVTVASAGAWAALRAAAAWAAQSGARRAATTAVAVTAAGGAVVAAPDVAHGTAPVPAVVHLVPARAHASRRHSPVLAPAPAPVMGRRRRRAEHHRDIDAATPSPSPAATSPAPSPSPSPSGIPTVLPAPVPTAPALPPVGDAVRGVRALPGLAWDDMPVITVRRLP